MTNAIRDVLEFGWPVRRTVSGRPIVLDLKTAARWSTGPVDRTAVDVHTELARTTQTGYTGS